MDRKSLSLGSLFDGSGGFPLGGVLCDIVPRWASEIEPFPIRVTTKRLPLMRHLGDISLIDGSQVEPVDIITFGSPCQDMSIAGKRSGLDGEHSGLFYQAIRIVKEMREKTNGEYPRYIVWENVPGAFSSNKGHDFKAVLEEIIGIRFDSVSVPIAEKWKGAGLVMADGFSLAWRVMDAQHWGVPQRRKRIYLVADLVGESAGRILFESESMPWHTPPCFRTGQDATGCTHGSPGSPSQICLNDQGGQRMDVSCEVTATLRAESNHPPCVVALECHSSDSRIGIGKGHAIQTLTGRMGTGGNNVPLLMERHLGGCLGCFDVRFTSEGTRNARANAYEADTSRTIDTSGNSPDSNHGGIAVVYGTRSVPGPTTQSNNPYNKSDEAETIETLDTIDRNSDCDQRGMCVAALQEPMIGNTPDCIGSHPVAFGIGREAFNQGKNAKFGFAVQEELQPSIIASGPGAVADPSYSASRSSFFTSALKEKAGTLVATDYKDPPIVSDRGDEEVKYVVRRLTPTECARLQGFPDWWCDCLETENPGERELVWWKDVFLTKARAMGKKSKPKSDREITKWLKNPRSDAAEYKMWGNGVALPNVMAVLSGIVREASQNTAIKKKP